MDIFTAQYRYDGPDRLDITVSNKNTTWGRAFAPTWGMVKGVQNGTLSTEDYINEYRTLILNGIAEYSKNEFQHLLKQERIVFVCFCKPGAFCHRVLLAQMLHRIAPHFTYRGEIQI